MNKQQKYSLDKSWKEEVPNYTNSCKTAYITGASDFQQKAIKALEKELKKFDKNNNIELLVYKAINNSVLILQNLKA